MKPVRILLFVFICFTCNVNAGVRDDSLMHMRDLQFNSIEEQQVFYRYCNNRNTDNLISLFLIHYENTSAIRAESIIQDIDASVAEIRTQFLPIKNRKKQIKAITGYVYQKYLKQYNLDNGFSEIFTPAGKYNCVSSTALYAILFSKLGIEYSIHDTPTHVFLTAYPSTDKILIEATVGAKENTKYSDEYKSTYLEALSEKNVISKAEYENTPANQLFEKYFYEKGTITLEQLAALQLRNYGLYMEEKDSIRAAIRWVKMSYVLYPNINTECNFENMIYNIVDEYRYRDEYDACNIVLFIKIRNRYRQYDSENNIVSEFEVMGNQMLGNKQYDMYNKGYSYFNGAFAPEVNRKIRGTYYIALSAYLVEMEKLDSLIKLPYLDSAFSIYPEENRVIGIILKCMGTQIIDMAMVMGDNYDYMMKIVDGYSARFEGIDDNPLYNYVYSFALTRTIYELGDDEKFRTAERYYDKLVAYIEKHNVKKLDPNSAPKAMMIMSEWFMQRYEEEKALEPILLGLKYFPENKMLLKEKENLSQ